MRVCSAKAKLYKRLFVEKVEPWSIMLSSSTKFLFVVVIEVW